MLADPDAHSVANTSLVGHAGEMVRQEVLRIATGWHEKHVLNRYTPKTAQNGLLKLLGKVVVALLAKPPRYKEN